MADTDQLTPEEKLQMTLGIHPAQLAVHKQIVDMAHGQGPQETPGVPAPDKAPQQPVALSSAPAAASPAVSPATPATPAPVGPRMATPNSGPPPIRPIGNTNRDADQAELNRLKTSGSGISQIHNPFLRGLARTAETVAGVAGFSPQLALVPGTEAHNRFLQNKAASRLANDVNIEKEEAGTQKEQAETGKLNAETAALGVPEVKPVFDQAGDIVGFHLGHEIVGPNSPKITPEMKDMMDAAHGKASKPTTPEGQAMAALIAQGMKPYEAWSKLEQDKNNVKSKPLDKAKADQLNAVWNTILEKHHLPINQFKEGMSDADAKEIASNFNNALGKQQGDTKITIQNAATAVPSGLANLPAGITGQEVLSHLDPHTARTVQMIGDGDIDFKQFIGNRMTLDQRSALAAAVHAYNPQWKASDYGIETDVRKAFTSGQYSQQLNSINRAREHMKTFIDSAKELDNGDVKVLNQVGNFFKVQFGSDKVGNLNIAKQAFSSEVGKSFAGSSVTLEDRKELQHSIDNASSFTQLAGAARTADTLLAGAQKALKKTYEEGKQGRPNFGEDNEQQPQQGTQPIKGNGYTVHPL